MIFFLSEFSRPFALGVPACHVVALAKTEASREGGFVVYQKIVKEKSIDILFRF